MLFGRLLGTAAAITMGAAALAGSGTAAGATSAHPEPRGLTAGWHTMNYPGAKDTALFAVSPEGDYFGQYQTSKGGLFGLEYKAGKWLTIMDPAGVTSTSTANQTTEGETAKGAIVGAYTNAAGVNYGYIDTGGKFQPISDPSAQLHKGQGTVITGVNPAGQVVGLFFDATGAHGFTYLNGKYTTIDYTSKGATIAYSWVNGISSKGVMVGYFCCTASKGTGSYLYYHGVFAGQTDPKAGAVGATEFIGIAPTSGEVVGCWWSNAQKGGPPVYGFSYKDKTYTDMNYPLAGVTETCSQGVTDAGLVDGYYVDKAGVEHGFVWVP